MTYKKLLRLHADRSFPSAQFLLRFSSSSSSSFSSSSFFFFFFFFFCFSFLGGDGSGWGACF